jgi:peptidyl-prolyl cis-trans isomerase D
VKKDPSKFAEIAKKNSEDEGSAANGGDLDFFGRGAMVKPFEDAAYGLKPGEISGVVESDFGYHVIQLAAVRGGEKKSYESVRAEIEAEFPQPAGAEALLAGRGRLRRHGLSAVREPQARRRPLEARDRKADHVSPRARRQGDRAARQRRSSWRRSSPATRPRTSATPRRSTSAPASSPPAAWSRYSPAHQQPLAEVKDRVRQQLAASQAAAMAKKLGSREARGGARGAADRALRQHPDRLPRPDRATCRGRSSTPR